MANTRRHLAVAAALVTCVTIAACDDVPLLPQWDADMYVPLGGHNVGNLPPGTIIPANNSAPVTGPVRTIEMDGTIADLLSEVIDDAAPDIRIELRLTKTGNLAIALSDTLFMAADAVSLATTTVANGFFMAAGATTEVDTLQLGANAITLLRQLVNSNGTLHLQARGRVASGAAPVTVQASDSINVKVGFLVRVPVAGGS